MRFIGRKAELKTLERQYAAPPENPAPFVVIYGRRRVGKSRLISEFIKDKPAFAFLATQETGKANLQNFVRQAAEQACLPFAGSISIDDWNDAFRFYADAFLKEGRSRRHIIVIDEFPYLVQGEPAFPSILQKIWDTWLQQKNVMLILCGSHESMMFTSALSHSSPLYGRRTSQIRLRPFSFTEFSEGFPLLGFADKARLFALTGGVPKYMEEFAGVAPETGVLMDEICRKVLDGGGLLYVEPIFLLNGDSAGGSAQMTILKTIASGAHKMSEMASRMGVKATDLSVYIRKLIDLGYLRREVPVTESNPEKSKMGLYFIDDCYTDFWFKFIYPYYASLDLGLTERTAGIIKRDYDLRHASFVFEKICAESFWRYVRDNEESGFQPCRIGRYWSGGTEIDVAAVDEAGKKIFLGECKFQHAQVGAGVLNELRVKYGAAKELQEYKPIFGVFSKSGFTDAAAISAAAAGDALLFDCGVLAAINNPR